MTSDNLVVGARIVGVEIAVEMTPHELSEDAYRSLKVKLALEHSTILTLQAVNDSYAPGMALK